MSPPITLLSDYHAASETSTFLFAPEIECALIGMCWREPDRLATVKRELDPALHFIQPHLRYLLEALDLAYRELGTVDFACVIQVLRELGRLEDCGGIEGVNDVYRTGEFLDSPIWSGGCRNKTDLLFGEYLAMLRAYAINRKEELSQPVYRFTGGIATLALNKAKRRDSEPNYIGEARIAGRWYIAGASSSPDGSFLNFRFEPKP